MTHVKVTSQLVVIELEARNRKLERELKKARALVKSLLETSPADDDETVAYRDAVLKATTEIRRWDATARRHLRG